MAVHYRRQRPDELAADSEIVVANGHPRLQAGSVSRTSRVKASIFIAVETYGDRAKFRDVKYAEADARGFATALEQHGFEPSNRELLTGGQATKTAIESAIRMTLKKLKADDTLYFYYAGHSFSKRSGDSFLTCFDTRPADAEHTSLRLAWLFEQLQKSHCRRVVMFLDACTGGLLADEEMRQEYGELNEVELETSMQSIALAACFVACRTGQASHQSSALKQGVWAHHLIQTYDGLDRTILAGSLLTAAALQSHLALAVPATLRTIDPKAVQTPWLCGSSAGDLQLVDFADIFATRKAAEHPQAGQIKDSILRAETTDSIKSLAGFKKSKFNAVPDRHDSRSQAFVHELAADDLAADIEQVRTALKGAFRFKRLELTVANDGAGAATITTPFFNYNVHIAQAPDDPGRIVWRRSVDEITAPDQVLSAAFEAVFAKVFDSIELALHGPVPLDQLVDAVESLDRADIDVTYDDDLTSCRLILPGHNVRIEVTPTTFSIRHPRPAPPQSLLKSLFDVQAALTQQHHVMTIPFERNNAP